MAKTVLQLAADRRARRIKVREKIIAALNNLKELVTWGDAAEALNKKRVKTVLGERWSGKSLERFVRKQQRENGVVFHERLQLEHRRSAGGRVGARRRQRAIPLKEVRRACEKTMTDGQAAGLLNAQGVRTGLGKTWKGADVAQFRRRHGLRATAPKSWRRP